MTNPESPSHTHVVDERTDLIEILDTRRNFLLVTVQNLTDEQAASHPVAASELCLGGLIKHVARTEAGWANFVVDGPSALQASTKDWTEWGQEEWAARAAEFQLLPGETLAGLLAEYADVARRTNEIVSAFGDFGESQPLPQAPWFPPNGRRSARQVFLHIAAETAHHSGHADILRESIDGQKTM